MTKKVTIILIILAILLIVVPLGWYYWQLDGRNMGYDDLSGSVTSQTQTDVTSNQSNSTTTTTTDTNTDTIIADKIINTANQTYKNSKHGYSLNYPNNWFVGYMGDFEEKASVVWFVSDKKDVQASDGGLPNGSKVEVIIQDLAELKKVDSSFPTINTIQDWLKWQRSNQTSASITFKDENSTIAGTDGVITYEEDMFGKSATASFLDTTNQKVYLINYLSNSNYYDTNLSIFKSILSSFTLSN